MAEYSTIKGFTVQTLASDPYASVAASGSWASGGTLNTPHDNSAAGFGIQTAAVVACGTNAGGTTNVSFVEEYDGSTWTEVTNTANARRTCAGLGTSQTAGMVAGAYTTTASALVEEYNGSTWSEKADLNTARRTYNGGAGTTTAGIVVGGEPALDLTEIYNGTSWSALVI